MNLQASSFFRVYMRIPRVSGGEPHSVTSLYLIFGYSPRERG